MDQSIEYLQFLDNKTNNFLFACYDYRKLKKGRQLYGTFKDCQRKLQVNNNEGFCVYVTINETFAASRKKEDIKRCRAIWVEDDEERAIPRDDFPLKPSLIVQSSPNKYHYYWFTSTKNFNQWNEVMQTMVDKWGCDFKARDISRVLRLPGYKHRKDLKTDFVCKIVSGDGQFYPWLGIKTVFPPTQEPEEKPSDKDEKPAKLGEYNEKSAIRDLMTSKNYHGSLASIAMSLTNKGISRELQYMTLFGLMHKIPNENRRPEWEHRTSEEHLYECIDTALKKRKEELKNLEVESLPDNYDPDKQLKQKLIEFPPGLMGQLCQEIYEMAPYPNKEIAIAAAFGLVAGIVGRGFNVLGMGLNIYVAILADSGVGKAVLKDSINLALRGAGGPFNIGASFVGRSRFTGPKAVFDMLSKGLSRICVIEEAGLMSESKAGDQSGLTRVFLDLFTSSGVGKWAGDEGYSGTDNSIPALHSPAMSIVSVSTPRSFLTALKTKSADVSGEVARLWMMRTIGEKPYFNQQRRVDFSVEITKRLGLLIKETYQFQMIETELKPRIVKVDKKYYDEANAWVDRENAFFRDGDVLKRTLCSRAFAKIMKLTAVCSLFNGHDAISDEEYKWVEASILNELNTISDSFTHESTDDLTSVTKYLSNAIYKSIKMKYADKKKNSTQEMSRDGVFTYYAINQAVKNSSVVRALDDDTKKPNPKTGLDKIFMYMLNIGVITKVTEEDLQKIYRTKSKLAFRITNDFTKEFEEEVEEKKSGS